VKLLRLLLIFWLCASGGVAVADGASGLGDHLPSREWGNVALFLPLGSLSESGIKPKAVVLLFSAEDGVQAVDREAAERLRSQGFAVALVDTQALLLWARTNTVPGGQVLEDVAANAGRSSCLEMAGVGQWLSQTMQQAMNLPDYLPAVLIGRGAGGWVVHSLLAQAPAGVFSAGLSVGFVPENPSDIDLCGISTVGPDRHISPDTALNGRWSVADEHHLSFDAARYARQAAVASQESAPETLSSKPYLALVDEFMPLALAPSVRRADKAALLSEFSLPVIEIDPQATNAETAPGSEDVLVVFFSGDGGWRDIDQQLGRELAQAGFRVLGIDALRYFWHKRTPESVATDIAGVIGQARLEHAAEGGLGKIVLIGYSFGANILPAMYNHLPETLRQQVSLVVLLSPELRTDFKIHLSGWLGAKTGGDAEAILPAALAIPQARLLCVQGVEEGKASLCSEPALARAEILHLPGGHHYDKDYPALAWRIVGAIAWRVTLP
jgi:type IV secretory pathway VirJ component